MTTKPARPAKPVVANSRTVTASTTRTVAGSAYGDSLRPLRRSSGRDSAGAAVFAVEVIGSPSAAGE